MLLNDLEFNIDVDDAASRPGDAARDEPPLVLLHGFTGSVETWAPLRAALGGARRIIALDLIGHGGSAAPTDPRRYSLDWATRDLLALLDALAAPRVDLLGYSLGGRVALCFTARYPTRVRRLILESASPGLDDETVRLSRVAQDNALADRLLRDGLPAFVDFWEQQALLRLAPHVPPETVAAQRAQRLAQTPLGLANSLRGMGGGRQAPLWAALATLDVPVTLIVGASDERYVAVGRRMAAALPHVSLNVVDAAGHTVHLDQPAIFVDRVKTGIDEKLTPRPTHC
jgi:2-succinyl-6-hydroxy-2,4-cyclohexadiene-1-carboxylate synthase